MVLQMDKVISHAHATLGTLMSQQSIIGGITMKISNISRYSLYIFFSCHQKIYFKSNAHLTKLCFLASTD
uniref:Uncharacterized protein n=1 Tax=Aegilops tauschii subsp. strangulata TaxID=200361 RepID=A0A452YZT7_AEGTS